MDYYGYLDIILDNFIKGLKLKKNKENNYITFSYLIQSIN